MTSPSRAFLLLPRSWRPLAAALLALTLALGVGGCSTNPATGRSSFTGFMSEDKEKEVGREEHPKILKEFGGEYPDPKIRQYVQQLGERLAKNSEMADLKFTFTVLNSDIVNAFALPGGFVYVTRGLMALASSEAELAGVIGHEIGHVTARHTAQRYSAAMGASILSTAVGVLLGGPFGQVANAGAGMALAGYSREQEFEADTLGVRYLDRSGFDDNAMASFLSKMQAESALSAELAGKAGQADEFSIMQSHPRTPDRVRAATEEARKQGAVNSQARVGRDEYLNLIDGMGWGGDRDNGWIVNREFIHPGLRIRFEVPSGFRLFNSDANVTARGQNGARIVFDRVPRNNAADGLAPADYLRRVRANNNPYTGIEAITINGLEAATGVSAVQAQDGMLDVRLVAIRVDPATLYRLIFVSRRADTAQLNEPYRRATYSFRRRTEREAQGAQPPRIRVVRVQPGDTVESLAQRMPIADLPASRFRVLNGLAPGAQPKAGDRVKIIAAQ
jgi:predicted Zn-dependent protease